MSVPTQTKSWDIMPYNSASSGNQSVHVSWIKPDVFTPWLRVQCWSARHSCSTLSPGANTQSLREGLPTPSALGNQSVPRAEVTGIPSLGWHRLSYTRRREQLNGTARWLSSRGWSPSEKTLPRDRLWHAPHALQNPLQVPQCAGVFGAIMPLDLGQVTWQERTTIPQLNMPVDAAQCGPRRAHSQGTSPGGPSQSRQPCICGWGSQRFTWPRGGQSRSQS